ncbi:MAG: hypothetical protein V7731_12005 [Amphritea sp.]
MSFKSQKPHGGCCDHGGKRSGCGRKPGIKTQPIRLPSWLLEQLNKQGDARKLIVDACIERYQLNSDEGIATDD